MTHRHAPSTADVSAARPDALLSTKLYVPRPRPQLLSRRRLIERLDECVESELTLVSAPAGFGKTTLLAEWSHRSGRAGV